MKILLINRENLFDGPVAENINIDLEENWVAGINRALEKQHDAIIVGPDNQSSRQLLAVGIISRICHGIPVLALAWSGDDRLKFLRAGVDCFMEMPKTPREIFMKIRLAASHYREPDSAAMARTASVLTYGPLVIDTNAQTVTVKGQRVHFKPLEYRLLERIAKSDRPISIDHLKNTLNEKYPYDAKSGMIQITACMVRKKLSAASGDKFQFIEHRDGIGYSMHNPPAEYYPASAARGMKRKFPRPAAPAPSPTRLLR